MGTRVTRGRNRSQHIFFTGLFVATVFAGAAGLTSRPARAQTESVAATAPVPTRPAVQFGMAARGRYVSVPSWFLGLFTKENLPLSSYHAGFEFFRRKGDLDVVIGFAYQGMSPASGNWLGAGENPATKTDYVQFRSLSMWSIDAAFVWRTKFNEYTGMHYGGGLGLGIMSGKMLRTSNGTPGCASDPGNEAACYPIVCASGPCTEQELRNTEGPGTDASTSPHRFKDGNVPGAIPILNIMAGFDLNFPEVPGLDIRLLEIGFYNAFFAGMGIGYVF